MSGSVYAKPVMPRIMIVPAVTTLAMHAALVLVLTMNWSGFEEPVITVEESLATDDLFIQPAELPGGVAGVTCNGVALTVSRWLEEGDLVGIGESRIRVSKAPGGFLFGAEGPADAPGALALTGLVTPNEALSGFSSPAVITVGAVLILSAGLARTGVANLIGPLPVAGLERV